MIAETSPTPESWNHQSAFDSLKANAKHFAGLENARSLILQSRQIRYLRFTQLTQQQIAAVRTEEDRTDPATEQASMPPAEETILEGVA